MSGTMITVVVNEVQPGDRFTHMVGQAVRTETVVEVHENDESVDVVTNHETHTFVPYNHLEVWRP